MSQEDMTKNGERYDEAFALLDGVREKIMGVLRTITEAEADKRPTEDEWSVGEIAHHLVISEREFMGVVAQLAANAPPHQFDYQEAVRKRPFRIEETWDITITGKFTTPPEKLPMRGKPLAELVKELHDARAHSRQMLAPYRDQDLSVKFFVHPRLGTMTLYERMAQIAYHELKHLKQIERVLARVAPERTLSNL